MNIRHKHYETIVAWASGKEIQYCWEGKWRDYKELFSPCFTEAQTWRIKPEPEPDVVVELKAFDGEAWISCDPNLRLIFDGETRKLKRAEMIDGSN